MEGFEKNKDMNGSFQHTKLNSHIYFKRQKQNQMNRKKSLLLKHGLRSGSILSHVKNCSQSSQEEGSSKIQNKYPVSCEGTSIVNSESQSLPATLNANGGQPNVGGRENTSLFAANCTGTARPRYALPPTSVNGEPGPKPITRLLMDLKSTNNPDPKILLLKFFQDNVWMIHDIIQQQIMLMYKQAQTKAILMGQPIPTLDQVITVPTDFSPEQQEAVERLVLRFNSASPARRRNLLLFIKDHSWILDAEIKRHKNGIAVEECSVPEESPDIAVLMSSVFGKLDLSSQ